MTNNKRRMRPLVATTLIWLICVELTNAFHFPTAGSNTRIASTFTPKISKGSRITSASSSALGMATWSNGQAIREYQDFLASGESYDKGKSKLCILFLSMHVSHNILVSQGEMNLT